MKPKALWNLLLVCLGILCMVQLLAQMLDWPNKSAWYLSYPLPLLGLLIIGRILLWDWNHHKADSKDKSFRLRK
tara:strand:- start:314 stop:535 length:222 start_codon:yes stop_codon:yes gene_type:complete